MEKKAKTLLKFAWAFGMILLGLLLNQLGLGANSFAGFGSVGTCLIYIGFIGLIVIGLAGLWRKKKVVDERMEFVAGKAMRATFIFFIILAFVLIVLDGIQPISMPYYLFLSYLVCAMLLAYVAFYRVLLGVH